MLDSVFVQKTGAGAPNLVREGAKSCPGVRAVRVCVDADCVGPGAAPRRRTAFLDAGQPFGVGAEEGPAPIGPSPPTRKEVCGTGAQRVLQVSILFLSVTIMALGSLGNAPSPEASRDTAGAGGSIQLSAALRSTVF